LALAFVKSPQIGVKEDAQVVQPIFEAKDPLTVLDARYPTPKALQILNLLSRNYVRRTVYTTGIGQAELARRLHITRQALSLHLKRLKESGFIQTSRDLSITGDGLRAAGHHEEMVIITARVSPQKRSEAIENLKSIPAGDVFRVAGDADIVIITEQDRLDQTLEILSRIEGILETRTLVILPSTDKRKGRRDTVVH
jgi:DNA-binding Lrp family transcriptional regulator